VVGVVGLGPGPSAPVTTGCSRSGHTPSQCSSSGVTDVAPSEVSRLHALRA